MKSWLTAIFILICASAGAQQTDRLTVDFGNSPEYRCLPDKSVFYAGTGSSRVKVTTTPGYVYSFRDAATNVPGTGFVASASCVGGYSLALTILEFDQMVEDIEFDMYANFPVWINGAAKGPGNVRLPDATNTLYIFGGFQPSWFIDISRMSFRKAAATARFEFVIPSSRNERVLIHKYRSNDTYPAPQQIADRQIKVEGFVRDPAGNPVPGTTVHFRLIDPPDPAPYVVTAGDSHQDDNAAGRGTLNGGSTAIGTSGADGKVSVLLGITDRVAGDNYQVEGSTDPAFNCGAQGCARSATYTAWKRVYIAKERMFSRGAFIMDMVQPADTDIYVSDISRFATGDRIRLIHAPPYQSVFGPPAPGAQPQYRFYSEEHTVAVRPAATQNGKTIPAHLEILPLPNGTPDQIQNTYGIDSSLNLPDLRDAVGVVGPNGPLVYPVEDALIRDAFEQSFVEYMDLQQPATEVPFMTNVNRPGLGRFVTKWANDVSTPSSGGASRTSQPNHSLLFSLSELDRDPQAPNGQPGAELGVTPARPQGFLYSVVWSTRIQRASTDPIQPIYGQLPNAVTREVTVHELTHQWGVNAGSPAAAGGHCVQERYQNDGLFCLMHEPFYDAAHNSEYSDGRVALHYLKTSGQVDSEYLTIRTAAEPMPTR